MSNRKTILSSFSQNLFRKERESDQYTASTIQKSSNISVYTSPLQTDSPVQMRSPGVDSLDVLVDKQSAREQKVFFSHRPERNLRKLLTKAETSDFVLDFEEKKSSRFHRQFLQSSQPQIRFKNDIDEFFSSVKPDGINRNENNIDNDQLEEKPQRKNFQNQYQLVTFTDWVEDIYGKDWFYKSFRERRNDRQTTILDIFTVND